MATKVIQISSVIALSTTTANVLVGNQFEFLDSDSLVDFGFAQSATGLEITIFAGDRTFGRSLIPIIKATSPVFPDDFMLLDVPVLLGERLIIEARNTTAGNLTLLTTVRQNEAA